MILMAGECWSVDKNVLIHMKSFTVMALTGFITACASNPSSSSVKQISPDTYEVSQLGGWGYDLSDLKSEVRKTAHTFASSAGKQMVVISEEVKPDERVSTYPADDDTYILRFRLVDRAP